MYRSILVPLDGSLPSEQSLPYAAALARRSGATIQLAYVHTPLIVGEGVMYLGAPDVQLWEEEKNYLLSIVERLKKMGIGKIVPHVLEGVIADTLREQALSTDCDLVVMTTHGRGPMSRFWLGSVADQLVHRLPIPLLLIHTREESVQTTEEPEIRDILVALDGTPNAEQILEPAGAMAKLLGASCTLLRVIPPVIPYSIATEQAVTETLADKLRAEAHVYLQRITASLHERGINTRTRIVTHAHPATALLKESSSGEYGMFALETHGRCGLPRMFLGSVADKVVRGATVPILVHHGLPC